MALARLRLREAYALYEAGLYDGAAYLAGYVVELALKARVCRFLQIGSYADVPGRLAQAFRTHSFDELVLLAGLKETFAEARARNPALADNWSRLTDWNPEMRYVPAGTQNWQRTLKRLQALDHPGDGVLTWISRRW